MTDLPAAAAALVLGASTLVLLLGLTVGLSVFFRRRAVRLAAREDTPLRRAAREHEARLIENPVMHWVPDDHSGGWHLVGSYLPVAGEIAPLSPPRRRRRGH